MRPKPTVLRLDVQFRSSEHLAVIFRSAAIARQPSSQLSALRITCTSIHAAGRILFWVHTNTFPRQTKNGGGGVISSAEISIRVSNEDPSEGS